MTKHEKGLSLVEVLIATVILAIGVTGVLLPMMGSVQAFHYLDERNIGNQLAKRKIWELEDEVRFSKGFRNLSRNETLLLGDKAFGYEVSSKPVAGFNSLADIDMKIAWNEGNISKSIHREFYVLFPPIEKT